LNVFNAGGGELLVVLVIILLVFGPSQIPKMARGLGQALREFRKAQHEITDEFTVDETKPVKPPDNKPTG
jgi:sec-independent protein translocase protein TatA